MQESTSAPRTLPPEEFARLIGRPATRILFICLIAIVAGIVRGFRQGWITSSFALSTGGVLTILGVFLFARSLTSTSRSLRGSLAALAGFVPYFYGLYLFAYEGAWGLWTFLEMMSLWGALMPLAFLYFGYRLVYWTWQMSEIAEWRRTGGTLEGV